jgi:hypothetical protein
MHPSKPNRWHDCFLPEDYWRRARREFAETPRTAGLRTDDEPDQDDLRVEGGTIRRMDNIEDQGWDISS